MRISDWSSDVCSSDLGALLWQHAPRAGVARIADDAFAERFTFDKTRDETFGQTIIDADRQHDLGCAHAGMECRLLRARLIGLAERADERFAAAEQLQNAMLAQTAACCIEGIGVGRGAGRKRLQRADVAFLATLPAPCGHQDRKSKRLNSSN